MDDVIEKIENNFLNIYTKFDILGERLNNIYLKVDKINEIIDIINSDQYTKIYRKYFPIRNYDLIQNKFFIYGNTINVPLKKDSLIFFEYSFNIEEYIDIPLIIRLKIGDFEINLNENNKIKYDFKLDYNITKFSFYLYLLNEKIYYNEKLEYLKKILFNDKEIRFKIFSLIQMYMDYYRKIAKSIDELKLKLQISALLLKIQQNSDKLNQIKSSVESNYNYIGNLELNVDRIKANNEKITNITGNYIVDFIDNKILNIAYTKYILKMLPVTIIHT